MGIIIGGVSPQDLIMDGRSVSLYVGGNPPTKVWPTRETVQITLGPGFQARDEFRAALAARGLDYTTVTELPFDIELVGSGNAQHLFYGCSALTSIPPFDMSQVTNANGMFQMCGSLVTVPPLDTSNVWNAPSMFAYCSSLTSVPTMDTSKMTNVNHMFTGCTSLTSVPVMDTSSVTAMASMFYGCTRLTQVPDLDTSQVTNMNQMFFNCAALTQVPDLDTSQVTNTRYMFWNCAALTDGNVRLIGRHPQVDTSNMIYGSGLTREPWYTADGTPIAPREVTILSAMGGFEQSATGDTDLVSGWPYAMAYGPSVTFAAPVTCNRTVRIIDERSFGVEAKAGTTISAETMVIPGGYSQGTPYVFTEVW